MHTILQSEASECALASLAMVSTAHGLHIDLADLLALECANLAEQRTLHAFPKLAQHAQAIGILDHEGFLV